MAFYRGGRGTGFREQRDALLNSPLTQPVDNTFDQVSQADLAVGGLRSLAGNMALGGRSGGEFTPPGVDPAIAERLRYQGNQGVADELDSIIAKYTDSLKAEYQNRFGSSELLNSASNTNGSEYADPFGNSDKTFNMDDYLKRALGAESGGNYNSKNPLSSARGGYQFIDSTWKSMVMNNPELGLTMDGRGNPEQEDRAIRKFTQDNIDYIRQFNIPINNATVYAAHFLGQGGAKTVLTQDDSVKLTNLLSPSVIKANPFLREMTVGSFKNWAAKKGGLLQ